MTEETTIADEAEEAVEQPSRRETGIRLLYVILFGIIYSVAEAVMIAVVIIQFGFTFINGEQNQRLSGFSKNLSEFIYQILKFVTFHSETKPFPFSDWPSDKTPV